MTPRQEVGNTELSHSEGLLIRESRMRGPTLPLPASLSTKMAVQSSMMGLRQLRDEALVSALPSPEPFQVGGVK